MSDAGGFIDAALQRESSWVRAEEYEHSLGGGLRLYGASVGAVRGTVRDALRRYKDLTHDQVTSLSSELWAEPVFERRLAAVVLLQSSVRLLVAGDLTRLEGFLRQAPLRALSDPLAVDVIGPLLAGLDDGNRVKADRVTDRWARDDDPWLRRAALLSHAAAARAAGKVAGVPDPRANALASMAAQAGNALMDSDPAVVEEAMRVVLGGQRPLG